MEKIKNVPKLRFPEFTGEWEKKKAGEVFKSHSNKNHNGDLPILAITQDKGAILRDDLDMKIISSDASVKSYKIVEIGDFIISLRSFQGGIEYSNVFGICSPAYTILKPKFQICNSFFKEYLKKDDFIQRLNGTIVGIRDGKQISYDAFSTLKLIVPSVIEQTRIASFLTSVDEKLQALKKKKSLLEQYKKGVMQQIFIQEIRFKDDNGNEFPEWEEKKLGDVCENIVSGKTKPELEGDYFVYGSTGIIGNSSSFTHTGKFILIARVGANAGCINVVNGKFSVTDNTLIINTKSQIDIDFLYYLLLKFNLNKLVFGSGQPLITGGQLKALNIYIPRSSEQTKIANFLSAIDEKINNCSGQIEKMELWKKGLLQKMFC